MEYLPLYNQEQKKRHNVKPGITGWAQINGRNAISWDAKFKLDVWYVENQSFKLDMYIIYKTIVNTLQKILTRRITLQLKSLRGITYEQTSFINRYGRSFKSSERYY